MVRISPNLPNCIETINLTHRFSNGESALNAVNLQVPEGTIYGFLGPNGAGKTTTLKLILGLLKKQTGEIRVFGEPFEKNRVEILKKIGSMIETPSIYGHLTAKENLLVWQKIYRCPKNRISEVLSLVGLENTGEKRAAQFSLGMKQRLSIAVALLNSPKLLILDEPTNGLDPNGILEIRQLLKNLNQNQGITILISSHILSEVEKLVTHFGIINGGKLLFQGTLAELIDKQRANSRIVFETSDRTKARGIIEICGFEQQNGADNVSVPLVEPAQIARINRALTEGGVEVFRIGKTESDLEKIFFELIGD